MHASLALETKLDGRLALAPVNHAELELTADLSNDPLGVEGVRMTYAADEEIFGEGEPANYVYRVESGLVRTYRILADGRRQISEFFLAGDVFGLQAGVDYRLSAEAVTDCKVTALRRSNLADRAVQDGVTAHKLWSLTLHQLKRSEEHMLLLGRKSASERVAWFLMDMADRIPSPKIVELPMSRQDIADYLGLTIETVSRTMTQLREDSLIELPSSRRVVLRNKTALNELSA